MKNFEFGEDNPEWMKQNGWVTILFRIITGKLILFMEFLMDPGFFMGHPGLRCKKFLAKVTGRTLEEADQVLYGKATWRSWKRRNDEG